MIYLSEFKVLDSIERNNEYEHVLKGILDLLDRRGIDYFLSDDFTSYKEIEQKIDKSDTIIALIDKYWSSSTWKLHEVLYPLEDYESMSGHKLSEKKREIILYWIEDIKLPVIENIKLKVHNVSTLNELKRIIIS